MEQSVLKMETDNDIEMIRGPQKPFFGHQIKFEEFCDLCENLTSKKANKYDQENIVMQFMNSFREKAASTTQDYDKSLFPVLRLLLPSCDRERPALGLKAVSLGRIYVKLLALPQHSNDAKKLTCFKSASGNYGNDFASILFFVISTRSNKCGELNIGDINESLDKIAFAGAGNKSQTIESELSFLLRKTTPRQHKWIVRIILKEMKLGMSKKKILDCFHPDAPELFDNCNSLLKVCKELEDENTRPAEIGIQLFSAVSPMLAERLDINDISQKLDPQLTFQVEQKFDGERFQVHMKNNEFRYFSRRGFDYSSKYGKNYNEGILTPYLQGCFSEDADSFVLDGEMMGWHKTKRCFGSKGMKYDVKKMTENSAYRPCFCPFDILYFNGKSLGGEGGVPLSERLKILQSLIVDKPGYVMRSSTVIVNQWQDIVDALNESIDKCEEGIVVKDTNSYYIANKRNAGWYKLKPEYSDGAIEDLDLMIVGGFYTENKKAGNVNSFLVAVGESDDSGDMPKRWLTVGRVGTGLSLEEREALCNKLDDHWRQPSKHPCPENIVLGKAKPDLWIRPEKSCLLQVKASELTRSDGFSSGYALRFPRIIKIRDDKPLKDAMTTQQLNVITKGRSVEKLPTTHFLNIDIPSTATRNRKRSAKAIQVAEQFRTKIGEKEIIETSAALRGRKICVLSDFEGCQKDELELLIRTHGGTPVQNIGKSMDLWCFIAGRENARVKNAKEALKVDIISANWLINLSKSNEPVDKPSPRFFVAITDRTSSQLSLAYDEYGDSYTEAIDEDTLRDVFSYVNSKIAVPTIQTEEIKELDLELFNTTSPHSFLRGCHIFISPELKRSISKCLLFGGALTELTASAITHVVLHDNTTISDGIKEILKNGDRVKVVSEKWICDCFELRTKIDESKYIKC